MQFYLNGFYAGDPAITPLESESAPTSLEEQSEIDVLIVGSGPAGLVLAAQLAQFAGITTRIVERRVGPLQLGQADGVACRTVEMFEAFGFSERLIREAYWVNETSFWQPDPQDSGRVVRSGRVRDTEDGLSEFPHVILNQARVHDFLLEAMRRAPARLVPDYGVHFDGLEVMRTGTHPVRASLSRGDAQLTVDAKYVVGCDGAGSKVRQSIGRNLQGDAANHAWGVMDVLAVTDFPDIRLKSAIQSGANGSILLIPREGGYLVRLYVDLGVITDQNRAEIRGMGSHEIASVAARVLSPYTIEVKQVAWFSVYEVAQRVTDAFDDATGRDGAPRVFIAGDACHTHSAKAGQGMNVSMQDAFNLGWKLAAVLEGRSAPALLETYSAERQPIAQELIDFDREWAAMLGSRGRAEQPGTGGAESSDVQSYFVRQGRYTAGVATRYSTSGLTGEPTYQRLAFGFEVGTRFHSAPVIRIGDAKSVELGHVASADGRWRLYAFGDRAETKLFGLCGWLEQNADSPIRRFTPEQADLDSVVDVRAILQRNHREVELGELPEVLRPRKGSFGLIDYEKAFTADSNPDRDIYVSRQIDRERGCALIVRPDQFVAHVLPLDAFLEIATFFDRNLLEPLTTQITNCGGTR